VAERLRVGDRAEVVRTFSADDVAAFAALSGDANPIHLDGAAAIAAGFDGQIVHGALTTALVSRLLGMDLPGPGTILLGLEMRFRRAVLVGQPVSAGVEVTHVREDKPVVTLRTWVEVSDGGGVAVEGLATVLVREVMPQ
jgi:acyl dehydratase